jgi:hypothetical protein
VKLNWKDLPEGHKQAKQKKSKYSFVVGSMQVVDQESPKMTDCRKNNFHIF